MTSRKATAAQVADKFEDPMDEPDEPGDQSEDLLDPDGLSDDEILEDEIYPEFSSDEDDEDVEDDEEGGDEDEDTMDHDQTEPQPKSRQRIAISPSSIPVTDTASTTDATPSSTLHPQKPIPYIPDAGHLLITDPNPLPASASEAQLASVARDSAQTLLNHLLTTCPITSLPTTSTSSSGVEMTLPTPEFQLPREKRVPVPKPPTKWETFAAKKGIGKNKREGKMVYDEEKGEWVPKWGYKGKNKSGEGDWLVEIDEKKEKKAAKGKGGDAMEGVAGVDPRSMKRAERKERMRRNERAQRANERKGRKGQTA